MMATVVPTDEDRIDRASWLTPELLVLLLWVDETASNATGWRLLVEQGGKTSERGPRRLRCSREVDGSGRRAWFVTIRVPADRAGTQLGSVVLRHGARSLDLSPKSVESVLCDASELGAACRTQFEAATRTRMCELLVTVPRIHQVALTPSLAANLAALRDQLRPRLPSTKFEPGPCAARLETVTAIDQYGFWLSGWIHDAAPRAVRLTAVSPEGCRNELPAGAVSFHARPRYALTLKDDETVSTLGYHAYVELEDPSAHPDGWVMEFRTAGGQAVEHRLTKPVRTEPELVWDCIQRQPGADPRDEASFEHQVLPVISRLRGGGHAAQVEQIVEFGQIPAAPVVSIVVAVRDFDRIQHQLISFTRDPDVAQAELIYVVPAADRAALTELAEGLHDLHGVPFRLAILSHPARRQRALNLGASLARGALLMLMSGDVFPAATGWLEQMRAVHRSSVSIGAVGPKLLYEDDSIAHAGAVYIRRASGRWQHTLPFAGFARHIEAAESSRQVEAVSDACMMVESALFGECGGFADRYLEGGDEGGDLCLRLPGGAEVWYVPGAELYLLDESDPCGRPSPEDARFNDWLLRRRCPGLGAKLGNGGSPAGPPGPSSPLPDVPELGTRRPELPVEILEIVPAKQDGSVILNGGLIEPDADNPRGPYEGTYSLVIEGWAISRDGGALTIEVAERQEILWRTRANHRSEHAAERYPDVPDAVAAGFQFVVGSLALAEQFELEVVAVTAGGARAPLGRIRGRRRPLRSRYAPRLAPLLITTIGRSGSTWLHTLVSGHPQVVALRDPGYEPLLIHHSVEMLRGLAEPESYMMAVSPQISHERWWLGVGRQTPLPAEKLDPTMARWMGRENVELLAACCQTRFDSFYGEVGRLAGGGTHRYFTEKTPPGATSRLIAELYPEGREIVLVRDFRDMICSIVAYNAKRGFALWGRGDSNSDEEWFAHLRAEADKLLEGWRERSWRAHLVRYEDLLADPAGTLVGVFSYLGINADPNTIQGAIDEASQTFPEVQAYHRTSPSFEASVGRWKHDLTPEQQAACAEVFDDILVEFGYEPTNAPTAPTVLSDEDPTAVAS
jgi:hypothetical protein